MIAGIFEREFQRSFGNYKIVNPISFSLAHSALVNGGRLRDMRLYTGETFVIESLDGLSVTLLPDSDVIELSEGTHPVEMPEVSLLSGLIRGVRKALHLRCKYQSNLKHDDPSSISSVRK